MTERRDDCTEYLSDTAAQWYVECSEGWRCRNKYAPSKYIKWYFNNIDYRIFHINPYLQIKRYFHDQIKKRGFSYFCYIHIVPIFGILQDFRPPQPFRTKLSYRKFVVNSDNIRLILYIMYTIIYIHKYIIIYVKIINCNFICG